MKRRLILCGEIGCGKSTLIKNALGADAIRAGGFVTLRVMRRGRLEGFDLAPAAALADSSRLAEAAQFLSFGDSPCQYDQVFSELGASFLQDALQYPYAVADEFGGMELVIAPFYQALLDLLRSDLPCVGVFKTPAAAEAMRRRLPLEPDYIVRYQEIRNLLEQDPDTELLTTTGRGDRQAEEALARWAAEYARG